MAKMRTSLVDDEQQISLFAPLTSPTPYPDLIEGTIDKDSLDGLGGDDYIFGYAGDDYLRGSEGNDYLEGGTGNDILLGGVSSDTLLGGEDADILKGGYGNDILDGEWGADSVTGGAGDDYIFAADYDEIEADYFDGGEDFDYLDYSVPTDFAYGIELSLTTGIGGGAALGDFVAYSLINGQAFSSIEAVIGTGQSDRISGSAGNESLWGNAGNDVLSGLAGHDRLFGGEGNDILDGSQGADILQGNQGNDIIYGGRGADRLIGNSGDDHLYGGAGNNTLLGGIGNDSAYWDDTSRRITIRLTGFGDGTADSNWVGNSDTLLNRDTFTSIENFVTVEGNNNVLDWSQAIRASESIVANLTTQTYAIGEDSNPITSGNIIGFNWLIGGAGNDRFHGNDNHNSLSGNEGDDELVGGGGDDLLQGGIGNDLLIGDDGYDLASWAELDSNSYVSVDLSEGSTSHAVVKRLIGEKIVDEIDTLTGIVDLQGGAGNDHLRGNDDDNWLFGGGGDDIIDGGNIDDCDALFGGDGDDYLIANLSDYANGGSGYDIVLLSGAGRVTINYFYEDIIEIVDADTGLYLTSASYIEEWQADAGTEIVSINRVASLAANSSLSTQHEQVLAEMARQIA